MSVVTGILRDLVARRLWPIAVALVAAALAMPMLLSKDPETPAPTTPAHTQAGVDGLTGEALVAVSENGQLDRRVLGVRKDPFRPTGKQSQAKAPDAAGSGAGSGPSGASPGATPATGQDPGGGGSTGGGSPSPDSSPASPAPSGSTPPPATPTPAPADPAPAKPTFELSSLTVRIDEGEKQNLKRLQPLPSDAAPAIIYLGLLADGRTAVFLLDSGVTADGDGTCHPSPEDCQRLYLHKGETEFFDVTREATDGAESPAAAQFQLDLLDIETEKTASAGRAHRAYAAASKSGRRALRARMSRLGRLRYDRRKGRLEKLSARAYRASMARASSRRAGAGAHASAQRAGPPRGPTARASGHRPGLAGPYSLERAPRRNRW